MTTASLFPSQQKSRFMTLTASRYAHLCERLERKDLPPPPFSLAQLRNHVYDAMGERYDGAIKCKYCGKVCDISEVEFDHGVPIERAGSLELDNIEFPCARDNAAKGLMTSHEFAELMLFLERVLPMARTDILHRLATYGKLVSGKRKAEMLLRNGGKFPPKKAKAAKPPMIAAIDEHF